MKRVVPIFLLIGAILALSSCKVSGPEVISSDGKSYEMVTAEGGGRATDENGNLIVAKEDENGNTVTEVLTEKYLIVDDDKLMAPAYDYEVPEELSLVSEDSPDPRMVNKDGTIQFHIMDKTKAVEEAGGYEEYVEKTLRSTTATGISAGEIEDVTISGIPMQRFPMTIEEEDGAMQSYGYFVKANNRVVLITLTSTDGGLSDVAKADEYVAGIDFINT